MTIYVAVIKSSHPLSSTPRLVIRDVRQEMRDYLMSLPPEESLEELAEYNVKSKKVQYYLARALASFLNE